jgi:hypothetical protein
VILLSKDTKLTVKRGEFKAYPNLFDKDTELRRGMLVSDPARKEGWSQIEVTENSEIHHGSYSRVTVISAADEPIKSRKKDSDIGDHKCWQIQHHKGTFMLVTRWSCSKKDDYRETLSVRILEYEGRTEGENHYRLKEWWDISSMECIRGRSAKNWLKTIKNDAIRKAIKTDISMVLMSTPVSEVRHAVRVIRSLD